MIQKPKNFDTLAVNVDGRKSIPDGFYEAVIVKAEVRQTKSNKNSNIYEMLTIWLDIAEGDYKDYYRQKFNENPKAPTDKKWGLTKDIFLENKANSNEQNEKCVKELKRFVTSVEKSNPDFKWDWDENKLKGKRVGIGLGLKEFQARSGDIITVAEFRMFRSAESIKEIDPEDLTKRLKVKCIDNTWMNYEDYMNKKELEKEDENSDNSSYITIEDTDDIPF